MTILEDLAVTAEVCGAAFSDAAAKVVVAELEGYEPAAVHGALARCRREVQGRLTLAAIIERLDDGRPGAEEAWAMLPKDEGASAVISSDMRCAMEPALELLAQGDPIAARMAFVEVYRRRVSIARADRERVTWHVSMGHDAAGRAPVLIDAMRRKRISREQALLAAGPSAEQVHAAILEDAPPAITGPAVEPESVSQLAGTVAASLSMERKLAEPLGGRDFKEGDPLPGVEFIKPKDEPEGDEERERYP